MSAIAIRLALNIQSAGVPFPHIPAHIPWRAVEKLRLSGREREALKSLLDDPVKVTDPHRTAVVLG